MPASDPFTVLSRESAEETRWIEQLSGAVELIRSYGFSADSFAQIVDAANHIEAALRRHEEIEEVYLFPLLDPHVPESVRDMRERRRQVRNAVHRLRGVIAEIEDSRVYGNSIHDLLREASAMVSHLKVYFADEKSVLFPLTRKTLTPKEYAKFAAEIERRSHSHV